MSRPLSIHVLKLFQRFDCPGNSTAQLGAVRVAVYSLSTFIRANGESKRRTREADEHGWRQPVSRDRLYKQSISKPVHISYYASSKETYETNQLGCIPRG